MTGAPPIGAHSIGAHPIGVGVIGWGLAGAILHAPVIAAVPRLRLAAAATSRGDAVRAAFPDAAVHADPLGLIADPAVELVVIASPNRTHAPLARAALLAGRHVVVDKPFVTDPADGEALIALAGQRGRMLAVFHNRRWDADFLTVERIVRSGSLGTVALAELHWDRFRPAIKPGWREGGGDGSGLLADLGPHLLDQALQLFGPPDAITADITTQRNDARTDDWFSLVLHYERRRVVLASSSLVAAPRPRFALHGTGGSFVKYGLDPQEGYLRGGGTASDADFGREPRTAWGTLTDAAGATTPVEAERGDWRRFYAGVADAIAGGGPPPVTAAEALVGLRLIAQARRSASEGRTIRLTTDGRARDHR